MRLGLTCVGYSNLRTRQRHPQKLRVKCHRCHLRIGLSSGSPDAQLKVRSLQTPSLNVLLLQTPSLNVRLPTLHRLPPGHSLSPMCVNSKLLGLKYKPTDTACLCRFPIGVVGRGGQTDRLTDRQADRQTDRPADRPTDRQTNRQISGLPRPHACHV